MEFSIDPSELVYFRKRIGKQGREKILHVSVNLHGQKAVEKEIHIDTTVQEKNITYPTDSKLHRKIADQCIKIAFIEQVKLRRTYKRTLPKLTNAQHNRSHPKRRKAALKAARRLKTIAGSLLRDLQRNLPEERLRYYEKQIVLTSGKNKKSDLENEQE